MMSKPTSPIILAGAGHANIQLVKKIAMSKTRPAVPVILISEQLGATYSGMLPGVLMDLYSNDEAQFHLLSLCQKAQIYFLKSRILRVRADQNRLVLEPNHFELDYSLLSLNLGVEYAVDPALQGIERIIPVKPINLFLNRYKRFITEVADIADPKIAIIGGGAAGVELSVAIAEKLQAMKISAGGIDLYQSNSLLGGVSHQRTSGKIFDSLKNLGVSVCAGNHAEVFSSMKITAGSKSQTYDFIFLTGSVKAPLCFKNSGLELTETGFVRVSNTLQTLSHPNVFAAGDCAHFEEKALAKAGVFAVRQGPTLAHNLFAQLKGQKLKAHHPQTEFLKLIHVSRLEVLGVKWGLSLRSKYLKWFKTQIDRSFMRRFGLFHLPMKPIQLESSEYIENTCGGCGSKIGSDLLSNVLGELQKEYPENLSTELADCGFITNTNNSTVAISIDTIKNFTSDLVLFGKISALHALSDLWVSGIKPSGVALSVGVSALGPSFQQLELRLIMRGILEVLKMHGLTLVNGHSYETKETQITLSVFGASQTQNLQHKGHLQPGDSIYLSKPIGIGTALVALMQGKLGLSETEDLIKTMTTPNALNDEALKSMSATTDVTGFGFVGHLLECLRPRGLRAQIYSDSVPLLSGAVRAEKAGLRSHLLTVNKNNFASQVRGVVSDLVYDPQTNGSVMAFSSQNLEPYGFICIGKVFKIDPSGEGRVGGNLATLSFC